MQLFTQKLQCRKQRFRGYAAGGEDVGCPGDEAGEQRVVVGVETSDEKIDDRRDVLGGPLAM